MRIETSIAMLAVSALLAAVAPVAVPAESAQAATNGGSLSAADLGMEGDGQQRWQSLPESRIVLNPFDRYASGVEYSTSEVDQSSGPQLPMAAAYYANDEAHRFPQLMSLYRTTVAESGEETLLPFPSPLTSDNGWALTGVDAAIASGDSTAVTILPGSSYGRITQTVAVDLDTTPYLTVGVGTLTPGARWAVEVDGKKLLPADSTLIGTNTYDLAALTGVSGNRDVEIKLWVAGGAGKTVTFDELAVSSGTQPNPATDKKVLWRDELSVADGWSTGSESASLTSNGAQGVVKIEGSGRSWGSVQKDFTVDVTDSTMFAINVGALTHKWALNAWVDGSEIKLQPDSTDTGWVVLSNFADQIGTGTKQVSLRLFTTGERPSGVAVDELVVYDDAVEEPWKSLNLAGAEEYATSWSPSEETFSASYGSIGVIEGRDVFASTSTVVREVDASAVSGEDIVLAGGIVGTPDWDSSAGLLTVTSPHYVQVYAFPAGAMVGFGSDVATAHASAPSSSSAFWTATLAEGSVEQIAISFAPVSTSSTYATDLTVSAGIRVATADAVAAQQTNLEERVAALSTQWNDYLAQVPVVRDFGLHGVDAYAVTPEETAATYYRAFVNLKQNIMPATPETNSLGVQLGTGKASTWMSGIPGAKNVATWDTLVGLQVLAYADPDTAWESFSGIMSFVQGEGSEFPGEITNDPAKGGEVLPSRKAQTAWILYNATGDRSELERIYPALSQVLNFAATNLHWTVKDRGVYNYTERDSEFVTSLIVDLSYAKKISSLLGKDEDAENWQDIEDHLYDKFDDWFVRTDGVFQQKVNLASDDDEAAVISGTSANGNSSVVATSLSLGKLSDRAREAVEARFSSSWKGSDGQFAGLADDLKGPNMNYIVAGLLDNGYIDDSDAKASTLTNTIVRDIVRTGWFAEVYKSAGNASSDKPVADGVRPSLFGIAAFIDSVWLNNGFRVSTGDASFVQLSDGNLGGIEGLSYLGRTLDVQLTQGSVELSGTSVGPEPVVQLPITTGEVLWLDARHETPEQPAATTTTLSIVAAEPVVKAAGNESGKQDPTRNAVIEVSGESSSAPAQGQIVLIDTSNNDAEVVDGELVDGSATFAIPTGLGVGEHRLLARFVTLNESWWLPSESGEVLLEVEPTVESPEEGDSDGSAPGGGEPTEVPSEVEENTGSGNEDTGAADTTEEPAAALPATGSELPMLIVLLGLVFVVGGGILTVARSRHLKSR